MTGAKNICFLGWGVCVRIDCIVKSLFYQKTISFQLPVDLFIILM